MLNNIRQQFADWLGNTTNRYLILLLACINFSIAFTWGLPQVTNPSLSCSNANKQGCRTLEQ